MAIQAEYLNAGRLNLSELLTEAAAVSQQLEQKIGIQISDVVVQCQDEGFWTATIYYYSPVDR